MREAPSSKPKTSQSEQVAESATASPNSALSSDGQRTQNYLQAFDDRPPFSLFDSPAGREVPSLPPPGENATGDNSIDDGSSASENGKNGALFQRMEAAFGLPFAGVKLRTDEGAARRAASLDATAYTDGSEIGFARGAFAPEQREGLHTVAHEFAHVAQIRGGSGGSLGLTGVSLGGGEVRAQSNVEATTDAVEADADAAAEAVVEGAMPEVAAVSADVILKSPLRKDGQKKSPAPEEVPPPEGTYTISLSAAGYGYTFNSKDILKWADPWREAVSAHFKNLFPSAPAAAELEYEQDMVRRNATKEFEGGGDPRELAKKQTLVKFIMLPDLTDRIVVFIKAKYSLSPATLVPATYGLDKKGAEGGGGAGTSTTTTATPPVPDKVEQVEGTSITIPSNIKPEDLERALKLLKEMMVQPQPGQAPDKSTAALYFSEKAVKFLLQIADDPDRAELIARLRGGITSKDKGPLDLEQWLETAITNQQIAKARKRLKLEQPSSSGDEQPVERRPVRGEIINNTGMLVVDQEARFSFEVHDDRDAFRTPHLSIQWVAHPKGDSNTVIRKEVTHYYPSHPQGHFNDKIFQVTFDEVGIYEIEAIVYHNFFTEGLFHMQVRVIAEAALAKEMNEDELKGFAGPGTAKPHLYDIGGVLGYQMGTTSRGKLDPKAIILSIEDRLKTVADNEKLVRNLIATYKGQRSSEAEQVTDWAENYLEELEESKGKLSKDKGGIPLGVKGVFVSREGDVQSRALNLLCYFFNTPQDSDRYKLVLNDFTQLYEQDDYRFVAREDTVEEAEEEAFTDQADAYPFGTLSITFQSFDETTHKPTDQFITFQKITDTPEKKLKSIVFGTVADIAVNIFAAVLMFVPGLQLVGIAIALAYNTANTVSQMADMANKGTLTAGKAAISAGQIALNVIPLVGKGAKILTIAGKSFYVMEAVTHGTNILLVTLEGMERVEKLRNGVVKNLADLNDKITHLEKTNQADENLRKLKQQQVELVKEGEGAIATVFIDMAKSQAFQWAGQHLIQGYMSRKFAFSELKQQGAFTHEAGATPHYDYKQRKIVGDEMRMLPAELERLQLEHAQNIALEGIVPDVAQREQIVKTLGDQPVEVHTGGKKTALKQEGGKAILEVADGATSADILTEAQKVKASKPQVEEKSTQPHDKSKAAAEDTFKKIEKQKPDEPEIKPEVKVEPIDPVAREAQGELDVQLEAQARAAYQAAKKKNYKGQFSETEFIERYKNGKAYDLEKNSWLNVRKAAKPPPELFPAKTDADTILKRLAGPGSTSTFKKYFEMLKKQKIADEPKVRAAIEDLRKDFDLDNKPASVDKVRHALKEKFRDDIVDSMFEGPGGATLDAKASHQKMLEVTKDLAPADKGPLTEKWLMKMREAAGAKDIADQIVVRAKDHPNIKEDLRLDIVEGEIITECKSGDGYLKPEEKIQINSQLKLVGTEGATINVRGKPKTVKKVKVVATSPEGARSNADWYVAQLEGNDALSVEVFNDAHEPKTFTKANAGELHKYVGKKTPKK